MKVTVIGCYGGFPAANEATSGYLFQSGDFSLLVDCGSAVLSKLFGYVPAEKLDAVVLSHYHHDHIADIGPLQFAKQVRSFLGKGEHSLPIYGHDADIEQFQKLTYKTHTKGIAYQPDQQLTVGPFTITFLKTVHPVTCYAMRITDGSHTVVYTADSSYQDSFIPFSENADLLISECNFYADQDGTSAGHMNSLEAGRIAEEAGAGGLLLTHLPHFGVHENLRKEAKTVFNGKVNIAKSGFVWEG
ncbi:MBL fold metallo-hydrolase [Bacillus halotolerans]|uniref:MBL fold metallo-hydrolase n=1 Tax=Bacillus halotolerans TaxID=260554 RepID=UPI0021558DB2|nr:MBL fold metallo-hydrolase [Bacillus halotolerans]MCR6596010.1 MBL fold metallo-hydrolase [Bacillus halotolerans]